MSRAEVIRIVSERLSRGDIQVIITTGGTGITSRDSTYEAMTELLDKRLDGFGELFRMISYKDIGPAAMLSRAVAGTARGKIVVSLPGSENAVRLALARAPHPGAVASGAASQQIENEHSPDKKRHPCHRPCARFAKRFRSTRRAR